MNELDIIKDVISLAGTGGTIAIIVILAKLGMFKKNGVEDQNKKPDIVLEKLDLITNNHLHEVNETLERIERHLERQGDKLEKINEGITHLKARVNGIKH